MLLCTDLEVMPIEDAPMGWSEDRSPSVAVARIAVPALDSWDDAKLAAIEDGMSSNPWRGLVAHQPLGSARLRGLGAVPGRAQRRCDRGAPDRGASRRLISPGAGQA